MLRTKKENGKLGINQHLFWFEEENIWKIWKGTYVMDILLNICGTRTWTAAMNGPRSLILAVVSQKGGSLPEVDTLWIPVGVSLRSTFTASTRKLTDKIWWIKFGHVFCMNENHNFFWISEGSMIWHKMCFDLLRTRISFLLLFSGKKNKTSWEGKREFHRQTHTHRERER